MCWSAIVSDVCVPWHTLCAQFHAIYSLFFPFVRPVRTFYVNVSPKPFSQAQQLSVIQKEVVSTGYVTCCCCANPSWVQQNWQVLQLWRVPVPASNPQLLVKEGKRLKWGSNIFPLDWKSGAPPSDLYCYYILYNAAAATIYVSAGKTNFMEGLLILWHSLTEHVLTSDRDLSFVWYEWNDT